MFSLILGIIGLHFQIKALSIAAISLGSITLTFTTTSREGNPLTTLLRFSFELSGLILGIIGVL
jgi:hypothetical protein